MVHFSVEIYNFQELLAEYEKITISYSALYTLLKKAGIASAKNKKDC